MFLTRDEALLPGGRAPGREGGRGAARVARGARLRRLTRNVILLLDADEAGSRAAERTLPLCIDAEVHAWRLQLPPLAPRCPLQRCLHAAQSVRALQLPRRLEDAPMRLEKARWHVERARRMPQLAL